MTKKVRTDSSKIPAAPAPVVQQFTAGSNLANPTMPYDVEKVRNDRVIHAAKPKAD